MLFTHKQTTCSIICHSFMHQPSNICIGRSRCSLWDNKGAPTSSSYFWAVWIKKTSNRFLITVQNHHDVVLHPPDTWKFSEQWRITAMFNLICFSPTEVSSPQVWLVFWAKKPAQLGCGVKTGPLGQELLIMTVSHLSGELQVINLSMKNKDHQSVSPDVDQEEIERQKKTTSKKTMVASDSYHLLLSDDSVTAANMRWYQQLSQVPNTVQLLLGGTSIRH